MTDSRWSDLFTAIAAHRASLVDVTGRVAVLSEIVRDAGLDAAADGLAACARELAAGLEVLTRKADGAQDETMDMAMADVELT